jgi:hypothetical protein
MRWPGSASCSIQINIAEQQVTVAGILTPGAASRGE